MISYKYKLYRNKNNRHLEAMLREASFVWNHALALQKRYYKLYNSYVSLTRIQKHFAKRIKRNMLHSQTVQEILQRLDTAYNRFFKHIAKRPPKFKRAEDFTSFAFKQGGFSLKDNRFTINRIGKTFKFSYSRKYNGKVKQVRIKRSSANEYYIVIITDATPNTYAKTHDGASVGVDFGLKTYMTVSDGTVVENPQYLKQSLKQLTNAQRELSRKHKGSNHRKKCVHAVAKLHERVTNQRNDLQWKLAHILCRQYDNIFIEDLQLTGMTRMWGRKMNDLAHGSFVEKLSYVASKYGVRVHKIDRWFPSSKMCDCGYINKKLTLKDRSWVCPQCGQIHDRDLHAAEMILRRGIYESESGEKTNDGFSVGALHVCIRESHTL